MLAFHAMSTFGDRQGIVSALHEPRYIYTCGWKFDLLAQALFDGELAPVGRMPTKVDVALDGMGGPHRCPGGLCKASGLFEGLQPRGPGVVTTRDLTYLICFCPILDI